MNRWKGTQCPQGARLPPSNVSVSKHLYRGGVAVTVGTCKPGAASPLGKQARDVWRSRQASPVKVSCVLRAKSSFQETQEYVHQCLMVAIMHPRGWQNPEVSCLLSSISAKTRQETVLHERALKSHTDKRQCVGLTQTTNFGDNWKVWFGVSGRGL